MVVYGSVYDLARKALYAFERDLFIGFQVLVQRQVKLALPIAIILFTLGNVGGVHASSSMVQENSGEYNVYSYGPPTGVHTTNQVSFTSNVASGDLVVVGIFLGEAGNPYLTVSSVTDSLGSVYTQAIQALDYECCGGNGETVAIYYATLTSGGPDIVTVTVSFSSSGTGTIEDLYIFEVSGVTASGVTTADGCSGGATPVGGCEGSTPSTTIATTTTASFASPGFLLAVIGTQNPVYTGYDTFSAGSGFTYVSPPATPAYSSLEYSTTGVSSPTDFPATITKDYWVEAGIAFSTKTETGVSVGCGSSTIDVGSSTTCTATVSGASAYGSISGEKVTWSQTGGTGSVTFPSGDACLLSSTSCYITVTGSTFGSVTVQASYPGDSNNSPSQGSFPLSISPCATSSSYSGSFEYCKLPPLVQGWNLISLPVVPNSTAITAAQLKYPAYSVFFAGPANSINNLFNATGLKHISGVWAYTGETWLYCTVKSGSCSGTLTTMQDGVGYWVLTTGSSVVLNFEGWVIQPSSAPPTYTLVQGWNLVGYKPEPSVTNETLGTYLSSITGHYDPNNVWVYNNDSQSWIRADASFELQPGQAMWILMTSPATLKP
jgi:hypothetical protein